MSIIWVSYNHTHGNKILDIPQAAHIFGTAFFLLSWLIGQFFRIKKQTKVENNFESINDQFNNLCTELENKHNKIINHILGGNSFPYLVISDINHNSNSGILTIVHNGEYPLYDVTVRICDLQKLAFEKF